MTAPEQWLRNEEIKRLASMFLSGPPPNTSALPGHLGQLRDLSVHLRVLTIYRAAQEKRLKTGDGQ